MSEAANFETEYRQEASLERELKPNDLLVPNSDIEGARNILAAYGISFDLAKYREEITEGEGAGTEAEFVLSIKNEANEDGDNFATQAAFADLKRAGVVVKYGMDPGETTTMA